MGRWRWPRSPPNAGRLRYAQVAHPADGDLILVTATTGTRVFVPPTPSRAAGASAHRRCDEVDDVAQPFAVLTPPLAALWVLHMRATGWTWPIRDTSSGSDAVMFLSVRDSRIVARGRCFGPTLCELRTGAGTLTRSRASTTDLADIRPHLP